MKSENFEMPGPSAPAFSRAPRLAACLLTAFSAVMLALVPARPAVAQTAGQPRPPASGQVPAQPQPAQPVRAAPPPISAQPVPGDLELAKLIWSTMAAVDHANRSGNYSVLRDISANGFQINNDPSRLAQIFAGIRTARIDLGNALLVAPTYLAAPQLVRPEIFEVKGVFALRPTQIYFDLYFQWEQGRWKLFGVSLEPRAMLTQLPGAPVAPQAQPAPRRN